MHLRLCVSEKSRGGSSMTLISSHRLHTGRGSGCSNGSTKHEAMTRRVVVCHPFPPVSKCCSLDHDCDYFINPFAPKPTQTSAQSGQRTPTVVDKTFWRQWDSNPSWFWILGHQTELFIADAGSAQLLFDLDSSGGAPRDCGCDPRWSKKHRRTTEQKHFLQFRSDFSCSSHLHFTSGDIFCCLTSGLTSQTQVPSGVRQTETMRPNPQHPGLSSWQLR